MLCGRRRAQLRDERKDREKRHPFATSTIQPDAGDGGTAVGGALFHTFSGPGHALTRVPMNHVYWGPSSDDAAIEKGAQG